uniref:Uncharacterized protein n=1 Tax=Coturnix japonica TaxID=93934 RepID=A0A8C2TYI1_COTJA
QVSPQPPLPWTKQLQFLQSLFAGESKLETWKAKTRHHDSKCNLPIKCLGKKRGKKISKVNYTVLLQVTTPNCWSKETYPCKNLYQTLLPFLLWVGLNAIVGV